MAVVRLNAEESAELDRKRGIRGENVSDYFRSRMKEDRCGEE